MWLCKHWCLAPPLMQVVQIKCICMPSTATGIGQYRSPSSTVGHKACPFYSGCCGLFKGYILLHLKQWSVAWTCPWAGSDHQSKTAETSRRPELQQMETYTLEGSSSTPSSIMQLCWWSTRVFDKQHGPTNTRLGQKCSGCIPSWSSLPYALWVTVYYHSHKFYDFCNKMTVVTFEPKSSKCLSLNHWVECRLDAFTTELRGKGIWIDCCTTWFMETSARPLSSTWSFVYIIPSTSNWIVLCSHADSCGVGLTLSSKSLLCKPIGVLIVEM